MILDSPEFDPDVVPDMDMQRTVYDYYGRPYPEEDSVAEVEKSSEEDKGTIATVAKKAVKGAAKGAVKGAAKETTE
jgi:hypothetical protein